MTTANNLHLGILLTLKDLATKGVKDFETGFRRGMAGVRGDSERASAALRAGMTSISQQLATLQRAVIAYQAVAGALRSGVEIVRAADDFKALNARLLLATGSLEAAGRALDDVRRIAAANGQELGAVGTLYGRLAAAVRDMGGSQATAAKATEAVTLALRISGAGAAEAASATLQLSQAFASGVLRGDEFNSINEAAPRIMQALADHLGVTRGKLREMAEAGKLTSEVMSGALLGSLEKLRAEADKLPETMEQAATRVKNAWVEMVARFDATTGASAKVAGALNDLARNMDAAVSAAQGLAVGVGVVLVGRMLNAWGALKAGAGAMELLGAAAGGLFRLLGGWPALFLALGVAAFKAGYELARLADTAINGDRALAAARRASFAATGALLDKYGQYQDVLVLAGAEAAALATKELKAYRDRLAGAIAYYNALYEAEAKRGDQGDKKAQAAAAAERDARLKAMAELKPILAARLKQEKDHTGALKATQEELAPQLNAALDAQAKVYRDAAKAVEDVQARRVKAIKDQAAFENELLAGPKKKPEELTLADFDAGAAAARQAAAAGDTQAALAGVEALREQLRAMRDAGSESGLVLSGLAKIVAGIENTALAKDEQKAGADKEKAFNDLLTLQNMAKSLEAIKIGVDQAAAERALRDAQTALQTFADAHPIIQKVIVQAQEDAMLAANLPKKAAGGLITGPGNDTSDNLLAWLSPGEYVLRAAAVRRYGAGLLAAMNGLSLPQRAVAGLPRFAAGGPVGAAPSFPHLGRIDLGLGGRTYPVYVEPDVAGLLRDASLARGGRL